jgi:CheY-like chemotaxis protein
MASERTVLVVAQDSQLLMQLVSWLRDSGCPTAVTTSFSAGKEQLECGPAAVLAEVRLGAYNGLHLALRARVRGIPAVVFGDANAITEREAKEVGATYLTPSNLRKSDLQSLLRGAVRPSRVVLPFSLPGRASCENAGTARGTDTSGGN